MKQKTDNHFTLRVLMSLVDDVAAACERMREIEAKVSALAKEHAIPMVRP